jgi:hypothetical protein
MASFQQRLVGAAFLWAATYEDVESAWRFVHGALQPGLIGFGATVVH